MNAAVRPAAGLSARAVRGRVRGRHKFIGQAVMILIGRAWHGRCLPLLLPFATGGSSIAAAAEGPPGHGGPSEFIFVSQIVILVLLGRLLGEAMQRLGQPGVMGQLIAGILLGPSILGALWPEFQGLLFPKAAAQKGMLDGVAQIGILMLLLLAGMETDLSLVRSVRRAAVSASVAGIAIPFACGFTLGQFLPDELLPHPDQRLIASLFLGTALSISSVKIVAVVVREMNFFRRNIGQVILASAIVDDTIGWIIIAITFGLAQHGMFDWFALGKGVLGTLLFLAISFTIGRRLVARLIRWTNDNFVSEAPVIAAILVVMGLMALTTDLIGVHTVLGAFVAGILVGESPILTRQIDEQLRGLTAGLFMPVFFGVAGLSADLTVLKDPDLALLTLGLILIASIGKALGAFTGGYFGGLSLRESIALATGMNARGSTEVVVATIGLSLGLLSQTLFTMILAMAVITTMAMPPSLRWALGRLPMRTEERRRLEREAMEERGFVANLERVLVAVDDSPKGKFAARLAGLLAGLRGMPVTVLPLEPSAATPEASSGVQPEKKEPADTKAREVVTAAAETVKPSPHEGEDRATPIEVIEQEHHVPAEEAVAKESAKGYDILFVGVEPTAGTKGGFSSRVSMIATGFAGSLAIVTARGKHEIDPIDTPLSILLPITGSEVSRRGAEVALALAKAAKAPLTALSVASPRRGSARLRLVAARRDAAEVLKEVTAMSKHYGVKVETHVRTDITAEDAILRQARRGGHNLIVLGVSRRPGEKLSFGPIAGALLESSDRSLMFVSS
jgi:Kef-type K+ transport system membrane component KefB/nucleotide-binding universal stress UspA family protein